MKSAWDSWTSQSVECGNKVGVGLMDESVRGVWNVTRFDGDDQCQ